MFTQSNTQENSTADVTPKARPRMPWRVAEVRPLDGFCLFVRFMDGLEGEVDMAELINSPGAGVFAELSDLSRFKQVFVRLGAVTWPGEFDLAPDAMYQNIKRYKKWVVNSH